MATPASAKAHSSKSRQAVIPWHGWAGSFHYNGVSYPGGNRYGPKMAYNNWEGGFHPTVFWQIMDRQSG